MKLLFVFLALATAVTCDKNGIVSCLLDFADTNKDGRLSSNEIDHLLASNSCMSASLRSDDDVGKEIARFKRERSTINGQLIMLVCDLNRDGFLSALDYDEHRGCAGHGSLRTQLCNRCNRCHP